MKYVNLSIKTYLNKLASKTPAPGGGSVAALFGAIGCALIEMVVNYSVNNSRLIKNSAATLKNYRKDFIRLMDEDIAAYNKLTLYYKQYGKNFYRTQAVLKRAALVPYKICSKSYEAIKLCSKVKNMTNKNLKSDIGCAMLGFTSAFESAKLNVDINIKSIKDKKFVNSVRKDITSLNKKYNRIRRCR